MTTACGSTTSSQGTPLTLSLEEAPFREYLRILREEGFSDSADEIERDFKAIFVDLQYSEEQLYGTSFENVKKIVEIYANELNNQLQAAASQPQGLSISGNMMAGEGADKLNREQLMQLARKQQDYVEQELLKRQLS